MTFKWTRRRIILLSIPPLLFVLYMLIGFFGVPAYVRHVLNSTVAEQTHGQAEIEDVSFNPFTLTLRVTNLGIVDEEGGTVASIDRIRANLQVATLWRSGFVLHEFYVEKPHANLAITENGTFNLVQLIKPDQEQEQEPVQDRPMLAIATLRLVDGEIDYTDRSLPETFEHRVRDINLTLNNFNLAPAVKNPLHFTARTPAGEHITWEGSFKLDPFSSEGTIKIDPAETPIYGPYYQRFSQFDVNRGRLSMQAKYRFLPMRSEPVIDVDVDSIIVEDLKFGRAGSEHEFYRVKRGEVSDMYVDLVGRKLTIHRVRAERGALTVRRAADGSLPIHQALAATLAGDSNGQVDLKDSTNQAGLMETLQQILGRAQRQSWTIRLDEFAIKGHEFAWIDQSFAEPVEMHVGKTDLTGGPVASEQQYAFPMKLSMQMDDGSLVDLDGKVRPMTPAIDAAVTLRNFDLAQIDQYLEKHVPLVVEQGRMTLDGQTELALSPDQSVRLAYRGNAILNNLHVARQAREGGPSAQVAEMTLSDLTISSQPWKIILPTTQARTIALHQDGDDRPTIKVSQATLTELAVTDQGEPWQLQVKQVSLEEPYLLAGLTSEGRFNIQQLLQAWRGDADGRETTGDPADAQPAQIKLGRVQVSEGSGKVFDRRMDEPVTIDIDQLEAILDNVTLQPGEHAQIKVTARLNQDANLQTEGSIEIGNPGGFTDLTIKGSALTMNQYQPYVERYLGYAVQNGRLALDATCKLQSRQLDVEVHLILSNFYLGQKVQSEHAVEAPIKLGLDLLRDRQGQVELTIPIQGNLAEPEFQLAGLISQAVGGVLAAIATAPFDVLASIVASEEKKLNLSFVGFRPGSAELSSQAVDQLNALAQALHQRPAVSLRVTGGLALDADRLPLKRRKFVMKDVPGEIATDAETAADVPPIDLNSPAYRQVIRQHYQQMQEIKSEDLPAGQPNAEDRAKPSFEQMEQAVLTGIKVDPQAFRDLARSRLRAVRQQLLKSGRLAADRIELGKPSTTATDQPRVTFEVRS